MNTYAYVGGNPVNAIDPYGLCDSGYAWKSNGMRGECVPESEAGYLPGNAASDAANICPIPIVKGAVIAGTLGRSIIANVTKSGLSSNILSWGKNSVGHLVKHRDALGLGNVSAQQAQKMIPQLRAAANQLLNNANPALTRVGSWNTVQNAKMYISNGKMLVTRSNGEFLSVIPKTANKWYNAATPLK